MSDPRRGIPGVDTLLENPRAAPLLKRFGPSRTRRALRAAVEKARRGIPSGTWTFAAADPDPYLDLARAELEHAEIPSLRSVVNATGVILHTNLGRAPLADEARRALTGAGTGYGNLEFELEAGARGSRYAHGADLLAELTGAEAGLVVNNCAAALVLAVNTFAGGGAVAVSRGELVEIGGGFRIPDILAHAGARLVEVGTTNRTRVDDYREAVEAGDVTLLLKVHRSNFRLEGFTEEATLEELIDLGGERGIPVVHDVGSGLLVDPAELGLPPEPRATTSIALGADLVVFSGDKLCGGPQAGLVVGRSAAVARLRHNPLCRALRVGKGTLASLEATLRLYRDPETARARVPVLRMLCARPAELRARAEALATRWQARGIEARAEPGVAFVGGGTYPGHELESWTVRVGGGEGQDAEALSRALRVGEPAVVGRIENDRVVLDLRTVSAVEEEVLEQALYQALHQCGGGR